MPWIAHSWLESYGPMLVQGLQRPRCDDLSPGLDLTWVQMRFIRLIALLASAPLGLIFLFCYIPALMQWPAPMISWRTQDSAAVAAVKKWSLLYSTCHACAISGLKGVSLDFQMIIWSVSTWTWIYSLVSWLTQAVHPHNNVRGLSLEWKQKNVFIIFYLAISTT